MKRSGVGIGILMLAATAYADIVSWRDADGVRHFTNLVEEVPTEYRDGAQVVVDERIRPAAASAASDERPATPLRVREAPRHEAEANCGASDVASAYVAGLRRGRELAAGGGVQINGPLAIAMTREGNERYVPVAPYTYGYLPPEWYPFVTTSFDRGRSRHLTLRMLLQDQFELDRAAPYVYVERLPPFGYVPSGPLLNVFMPRGLPPYSVPPTSRVIVR